MRTVLTIEARRFPVTVKDAVSGEIGSDTVILSKEQLQAAQLVGQSSKELICRLYQRQGFRVLDIGKAEKRPLKVELSSLWGGDVDGETRSDGLL